MNAVSGPPVALPQALFDGSQTGVPLGDGRLFPDVVCSRSPENIQSSLPGSSVEPVNFNVLLGYGEATGHLKPLSENPDLRNETVGSAGLRSPRRNEKVVASPPFIRRQKLLLLTVRMVFLKPPWRMLLTI